MPAPSSPAVLPALPPPAEQAQRLVDLGVPALTGLPAAVFSAAAARAGDGLLVVHPDCLPASALVPLLRWEGRPGFLVVDMADVDDFAPVVELPPAPVYLLREVDRGDAMANWSPDEALPALTAAGRTPMTVGEGVQWLLHRPEALARNHCFMTIGSRARRPSGALDARTPAVWISNGTGRDGAARRNAAKVGWCWAGNRHTWLGMASAAAREGLPG
ncbi:DUF5701 family protein [Modestobacter sp. NPDC049651]|uniref:DUF5701 family protein n=1 Tax=unclassified Modestobacter TaxID=2643866 RepID=UPI0033E75B20